MVLWFIVKTDNTAYQALVLVWLGCGNLQKTYKKYIHLLWLDPKTFNNISYILVQNSNMLNINIHKRTHAFPSNQIYDICWELPQDGSNFMYTVKKIKQQAVIL